MSFKEEIYELLKKYGIQNIELEVPPDSKLGDFALPCFTLAKEKKKAPNAISEDLAKEIQAEGSVKEIKNVGPYVNFFIDKSKLAEQTIKKIFQETDLYGHSKTGEGKKVVVEFPAPNTNKPLHLGHMRNMALGACLANIIECQGYKVFRVNLNNDRGIHICKSMLAYKLWGNNKTPESDKIKSDHFVGKYYVEFAKKEKEDPKFTEDAQEMLRKWEAEDPEVRELWEKMNSWALSGFDSTYKHFGLLPFDKVYYESNTYKDGKNIVLEGLDKGLFQKRDDDAIVVDLEKEGLGEKVLVRADGTTVYITQDLHLANLKYNEFKFDRSVYVVATEQKYHFNVLFTLLKKLQYPFAEGCYHFSYGMVHLPEGRMKSREGTAVDADDLMTKMEDMAGEAIKERHDKLGEDEVKSRSQEVGIGAIKFYLLKNDANKDMTFNPKESLSFEGDTGPYLQYTHARACSILRKAKEEKNYAPSADIAFNKLTDESELALIDTLAQFPSKTGESFAGYKPHLIGQYLLTLARAFNEFYHSCPCIKEENEELAKARLSLIDCTRQTIKNGLTLLGITAIEAM
jgi:arginyl-tRNA synthetase